MTGSCETADDTLRSLKYVNLDIEFLSENLKRPFGRPKIKWTETRL
jgi:hypothetical protein